MILKRIRINNFGCFSDREFVFSRGHNLVFGPNETGKTTILEAFCAALFGVSDPVIKKSWITMSTSEVELELETEQSNYIIERELVTNRVSVEQRAKGKLQTLFSGRILPDQPEADRYLHVLSSIFGFVDEALFRTSFLSSQRQAEPPVISRIAEKIKPLLQEFGENVFSQVQDSILKDYFDITGENLWGEDQQPGEFEEVRDRLRQLEKTWHERMKSFNDLDTNRQSVGKKTELLEKRKNELTQGETFLLQIKKFREQESSVEDQRILLEETSSKRERLLSINKRRRELDAELNKLGLGENLDDNCLSLLNESEKNRNSLIQLQEEAVELRGKLIKIDEERPSLTPSIVLSGVITIILLMTALFDPKSVVVLLPFALLLLIVSWIPYVKRGWQFRADVGVFKGRLGMIEEQRENFQLSLEMLDQKLEDAGVPLAIDDSRNLLSRLEEQRRLSQELTQIGKETASIPPLEDMDVKISEIEQMIVDGSIPEDVKIAAQDMDVAEIEEKLAALSLEIINGEEEIDWLERKSFALVADLTDLRDIEQEGDMLRLREDELKLQKNSLAIAYDFLREEVNDFRRGYFVRFVRELENTLDKLSNGELKALSMDDEFNLSLSGTDGKMQPLESFSKGKYDTVNLAMRTVLSRRLFKQIKPPLLFDEPLVSLEKEKRSNLLKNIGIVSADQQIIFFTHDEDLLKTAIKERWNLLKLVGNQLDSEEHREESEEHGKQLHLL